MYGTPDESAKKLGRAASHMSARSILVVAGW